MGEMMYDINSGLIAVVLFISMVLAIEIGFRLGLRRKHAVSADTKTHVNSLQNSILGILALLLGFTFSLSLQRFDSRSEAVVEEANAIGTTWLRAQLLPASLRDMAQVQLRDYVDARVRDSAFTLAERGERAQQLAQAAKLQNELWRTARQAAATDPSPVTSGLFIQSLNEMIDSFGRRDAALNRHVPELVLLLLYGTFLMAGAIVGYSTGIAGHRPSLVSYFMVLLIVVLVFIILDLDRPRRGLIEVSQKPLFDLQTTLHQGPDAADRH